MDFTDESITKSAQETADVGASVARYLRGREGPRILCLYGQLGSGKTTFTQGFARGLGITTRLPSPTFIIVRRYTIPQQTNYLYHVDLYRLQKTAEMDSLGIPEILSDLASYTVIEWAERLGELLPKKRLDIHFSTVQDDSHVIQIEEVV